MKVPTLPGITARTVATPRLTTRVLFCGPEGGEPVLFLHGNINSATWWEETMLGLPDGYQGIAPDQRGFGEADPEAKIDATQGLAELAEDAFALLDELGHKQAHAVGSSLGGSVIWWMLVQAPERLKTVTLIAPGSPYGFGGTKDLQGTPCFEDYAGSGAGLTNPKLVELVQEQYAGAEEPLGIRSALRTLVYKPPFIPEREDALVASALSIHLGEQDWPGDKTSSPNWPYVAPGKWGPANAVSAEYTVDVEALVSTEPKVDILWIRGDADKAVANAAASDVGHLGALGLIPGFPGPEVYPPQPMVDQTRAVLERYAAWGGAYREVVIEDAGHVPHIEKPDVFNRHFHEHIR